MLQEVVFAKSATFGGKGYFAAVGTYMKNREER